MTIECNAIITKATLSSDDHGSLVAWLALDYGGLMQGFGGYSLYAPSRQHGKDFGGWFLWRVLEIADVTEWGKLPGKTVRVRRESEFGAAEAIGHIVEDDWFYPSRYDEDRPKSLKERPPLGESA